MKHLLRFIGAISVLALMMTVPAAFSAAGNNTSSLKEGAPSADGLTSPLSEKQAALKQAALTGQLNGTIPTGVKVAKVAKGQYVELAREGEDSILTILGQFGTLTATTHGHGAIHGGGLPGPLHNQIPQPNRAVDNTTIWAPDFSQSYYNDLLFNDAAGANSMRNYYKQQSSNRYTVNGGVTGWTQVPFNARSYGQDYCGSIVCQDTWRFVNDSADAWGAS